MRKVSTRRRAVLIVTSCALVALCLAARGIPADAQATDGAAVSVTCRVLAALEASFPGAVDLGNLSAGSPAVVSAPQTVTVWSNAPWALSIRSDADDGRMREWTGSAYVSPSPRSLSSPLEWRRQDAPGFAPISADDATVASGMPATGSTGASVAVLFRQAVSYDDGVLPDAGHSYRIEVTYTVAQTY